jgi:flagellar biosynthesis component FlhA
MKNSFVWTILGVVGGAKRISFLLLAVLLCTATFWLGGCEQPGETTAEGHRRHLRNLSINQQNLNADIDRTLLIDKPSKLTDKKIPPEIGD